MKQILVIISSILVLSGCEKTYTCFCGTPATVQMNPPSSIDETDKDAVKSYCFQNGCTWGTKK